MPYKVPFDEDFRIEIQRVGHKNASARCPSMRTLSFGSLGEQAMTNSTQEEYLKESDCDKREHSAKRFVLRTHFCMSSGTQA